MKRRGLDRLALRALMKADHLLGLVLGRRLAEMRERGDVTQALLAKHYEQTLHLSLFQEALDVNNLRWDKLPERQRPHHSPESRFRILRLMHLWALSHQEAARIFCVSTSTIARWQGELAKDPDKTALGSLLRPVPPVRRYADNVRHLIQAMALAGFPGDRTIAQTLARAGWMLARRTVGRIRKERPIAPPEPPKTTGRAVRAGYPNHVWMADLTEVPSLLRIFSLKLAVVFDVFSRLPLAFRVFTAEPSAEDIAELFAHAASRHGPPKHFVSDQGPQFTASAFRERLKTLSVRHRFGAIGKTGSIALIERLWLTLKERLRLVSLSLLSPWTSSVASTRASSTTPTSGPTRRCAAPLRPRSTSVSPRSISPPYTRPGADREKPLPGRRPSRSPISTESACSRSCAEWPRSLLAGLSTADPRNGRGVPDQGHDAGPPTRNIDQASKTPQRPADRHRETASNSHCASTMCVRSRKLDRTVNISAA